MPQTLQNVETESLQQHSTPKILLKKEKITNQGSLHAKPFVKWAGGKKQLLTELAERLPAPCVLNRFTENCITPSVWCSMERKVSVRFFTASASPHPPTVTLQGALYLAVNFTGFSLLHSAMPIVSNTIFLKIIRIKKCWRHDTRQYYGAKTMEALEDKYINNPDFFELRGSELFLGWLRGIFS